MNGFVRTHAWVLGLAALLAVLLIVTKLIQPSFGASGLESIARAALPFAFATAGMAVVVIVVRARRIMATSTQTPMTRKAKFGPSVSVSSIGCIRLCSFLGLLGAGPSALRARAARARAAIVGKGRYFYGRPAFSA